ncbi:MAG: hypothetical protein DMF56_08610 [Acidobacteria bacterium]|nr:MAG: hypothetical protein DMF56_08610 [Acidobacteriota bacterium]
MTRCETRSSGSAAMFNVGLTPVDVEGYWVGGRHYLQHLVRCIRSLPRERQAALIDVYWGAIPDRDPFAEVRSLIDQRRAVAFPPTAGGRLFRKAKRAIAGIRDARDLFAGIDVTFPLPLAANQGIPYIFWIPDFQHEHLRDLYDEAHYTNIADSYTQLSDGAARIVVGSEFGLRDLARFYPRHVSRSEILRFCSVPDEEWFRIDPVSYCDSIGLTEPFFVVSNQFTEHKNHLAVVEAVQMQRDRGVCLHVAFTGSDYDFRGMNYFARVAEKVRTAAIEKQVRFLGLLPRAEQIAVMRRALAVLQPSRFEGWSTVIEDAKSIGKPVIASEFPVHREQLAGREAWFAGVDDIEGWGSAMAQLAAVLRPGPDRDQERAAEPLLRKAMHACGEKFVEIVALTVS